MEPFDQSEFDVIAIDQIYFICLSLYCKATWFVEQFVFATRDTKQLKPVQELTIRYIKELLLQRHLLTFVEHTLN